MCAQTETNFFLIMALHIKLLASLTVLEALGIALAVAFGIAAALGNLSKLNCRRLPDISARQNYLPIRRMGRAFCKTPLP